MNRFFNVPRYFKLRFMGKVLLEELWREPRAYPSINSVDKYKAVIGTHIGNKRSENQDRAAIFQVHALNNVSYFSAIVCDGVGGTEKGGEAAALAVASFIEELAHVEEAGALDTLLEKVLRKVDNCVRDNLEGKGATTASLMVISSQAEFAVINIGDSRIYSWSKDEKSFSQVSVDDTLENEIKNFPKMKLSALEARGLRGGLSQAVGERGRDARDLKINFIDMNLFSEGVAIVSDGAWSGSLEGFESIGVNSDSSLDLVRRTLAFANWSGGKDNVSIIAIDNLASLIEGMGLYVEDDNDFCVAEMWHADGKNVVASKVKNESGESGGAKKKVGKEYIKKRARNKSSGEPAEREGDKKNDGCNDKENEAAAQLELGDEVENAKIKNEKPARPKVEISTDDDAKER